MCKQKFVRNSLYETVVRKKYLTNFFARKQGWQYPSGMAKILLRNLIWGIILKMGYSCDIYKAIQSVKAHNIQQSTCQERRNYSKAVNFSDSTSLITYPQLFYFLQKSFLPRKCDYPV